MAFDIITIHGEITVGNTKPRFRLDFDENKGAWVMWLNKNDEIVFTADAATQLAKDIKELINE
jgi:hypothetical protein